MVMVTFCHKEITADGEVMLETRSSPTMGQTRDIQDRKKTSTEHASSMPLQPWRSTTRARVRSGRFSAREAVVSKDEHLWNIETTEQEEKGKGKC
jgi:hypothetical protein